MPDVAGNPTPGEISTLLAQFTGGPIGSSPIFGAAVDAFKANTLPVIQQQFQLQGLGNSPALGQAAGTALGANLVPLLQGEMANRLAAIQQMQGRRAGMTSELGLAANIVDQNQQRALDAARLAGSLQLGLSDPLRAAAQLGQSRQQLALESFGAAGQAQRGVELERVDAQMQDFLRRQALSEAATTGVFGGSVLPPTLSQSGVSKTSSGGGK